MAYTPTQWVNGQPPALNAENLNKIENGIEQTAAVTDKLQNVVYENGEITPTPIATYTDQFCILSTGAGREYTSLLVNLAGAHGAVYECQNGDAFKITAVLSGDNFVWGIGLDENLKTTDYKIVPETYSYDYQTKEITINFDTPYILIQSRYNLTVSKAEAISKVASKEDIAAVEDKITPASIEVKSENIFDISTITSGFLAGDGSIIENSTYFVSDFIYVEAGNYVVQSDINGTSRIAALLYDTDKNYIAGTYKNQSPVSDITMSVSQAGYIRFSTYESSKGTTMVFAGSTPATSYKEYYKYEALNPVYIADNVLWGKKWAVLGDSFTNGVGGTVIGEGRYKNKNVVYPYLIGNNANMEIVKFFSGGRTLAYPATPGSFDNSVTCPTAEWYYQNIPEDIDYITIYLGINDSHHAQGASGTDGESTEGYIPLGTINDNTVNSYYGAWNVVIKWLIEHRPFAHIGIIISNGCDTEAYRTAQIEIARKYGIPFIDLNGDDRTPAMIRSQNPNIDASVKTLIDIKQAYDYPSNTHPNDNAHRYEATFIENFLRTL